MHRSSGRALRGSATDFRTWLACREMIARRCTLDDRRSPNYGFTELARLTGVSQRRARASVGRLVGADQVPLAQHVGMQVRSVDRARAQDRDPLGPGEVPTLEKCDAMQVTIAGKEKTGRPGLGWVHHIYNLTGNFTVDGGDVHMGTTAFVLTPVE